MIINKIILESLRQAISALHSNMLRTFLSLLGIMIGIFCIIIVKSAVDSFEDTIKNGFSELGSNVIYIDKMPWNEDHNLNYWKYTKRPDPSLSDFEAIDEKSKNAAHAAYAIFTGGKTMKYRSNSVSGVTLMGTTIDYQNIKTFSYDHGRFFSQLENNNGSNKVILGYILAEALLPNIDPIGKSVKLLGQKYTVIGVLEKEGESMFNFLNFDEVAIVSLTNLRRFVNIKNNKYVGNMLTVQSKPDVDLEDLKDEVAGILRAERRLRPIEDENFAINEISMLNQVLDKLFGVVNFAGTVIGIFAIIVGMFSVANIMFVSVKERTNIIGIKKAIGATRGIILSEFLFEAIILCLFGGLIGIFMVFIVLKLVSAITPLQLYLTFQNVVIGLGCSVVVGVLAGIIPAILASKLDPVEAIRQ